MGGDPLPQRLKTLERENKELRRANESLRKATAYVAMAELDRRMPCCTRSSTRRRRPTACRVLEIARSGYYVHTARAADPARRSARAQRDATLQSDIRRV